jgi:hypothetical protein
VTSSARGRLVGDQQVGFGDQHHGDHRALAHAAGHLVRIQARHHPLGVADLHRFQRVDAPAGLALAAHVAVAQRSVSVDLAADGHHRVERCTSGPAAPCAMRLPRRARTSAPVGGIRSMPVEVQRVWRRHGRGGADQPQDRAAGLALARAAIRRRWPAARAPA